MMAANDIGPIARKIIAAGRKQQRRVSTSLRQLSREFTEQHLPRADRDPRARPAPRLAG